MIVKKLIKNLTKRVPRRFQFSDKKEQIQEELKNNPFFDEIYPQFLKNKAKPETYLKKE